MGNGVYQPEKVKSSASFGCLYQDFRAFVHISLNAYTKAPPFLAPWRRFPLGQDALDFLISRPVAQAEALFHAGDGEGNHSFPVTHKSARHLLGILAKYEDSDHPVVYVTVAGRSNALGGMVDANTVHPVITCPPVSSSFGGADIYSSLRMPSGVAPLVILEPSGAAVAAAKVLATSDPDLRARVATYQGEMTQSIVAADASLNV